LTLAALNDIFRIRPTLSLRMYEYVVLKKIQFDRTPKNFVGIARRGRQELGNISLEVKMTVP
jgi:hypothetical protein